MSKIPAPLAPHPAPEVHGRIAEIEEIPKNALALALLAYKHGWDTNTTYARGTSADNRGRPGKVVNSIVVRVQRAEIRLTVCWVDSHYDTAMEVTSSGFWCGGMTLTQVRQIVASAPLRVRGES